MLRDSSMSRLCWLIPIILFVVIGCRETNDKAHDDEIRKKAISEILDKQSKALDNVYRKQKDANDEEDGKFRI